MSRFNPYVCTRCHLYGHDATECPMTPGSQVETPSHNGTYRGPVPVRVVERGVSGEDISRRRGKPERG